MLWRKNTLNEGGGSAKSDILFMGGQRKVTLGDMGGGGVKNLKKRGTSFVNGPFKQKKFTFLLHLQNVYESIKMLNQKNPPCWPKKYIFRILKFMAIV